MSRIHRLNHANREYHVIQHGIDDSPIFRDDPDRSEFLRLLGIELVRSQWTCLAYCLMTTHYHLLVRLEEPTLSSGFQHLNGRYAQWFNIRHRRRGHVFEARFRSWQIETESHRYEVARYVHLNPTRAMRLPPEHYPWSDYAATIGLRPPDALVDAKQALEPFGTDLSRARSNYRSYVGEAAGA